MLGCNLSICKKIASILSYRRMCDTRVGQLTCKKLYKVLEKKRVLSTASCNSLLFNTLLFNMFHVSLKSVWLASSGPPTPQKLSSLFFAAQKNTTRSNCHTTFRLIKEAPKINLATAHNKKVLVFPLFFSKAAFLKYYAYFLHFTPSTCIH